MVSDENLEKIVRGVIATGIAACICAAGIKAYSNESHPQSKKFAPQENSYKINTLNNVNTKYMNDSNNNANNTYHVSKSSYGI